MNLFKLSFMNLKQNIKNYGMYIFSMIFSILVFYNFVTLMFSKQFTQLQDLNVVSSVALMCALVLFLFFIYFISYSSGFFIEQRKKEFGIYTFMGVANKKIAILFAGEGFLIGLIALIGGILGGILTNKLFLMALVKASNMDNVMKFEISWGTIIATSVTFMTILVFVFIKEYVILLRTDITKLINATNIYQSEDSKYKTLQGILGLLIIVLAYALIIYYKKFGIALPMAIMGAVIMIIVGTILLFKGFFTFIISKLINNKQFLYRGTNVLSFNNIIFRIRDNNKVLGQIAVLITCCLTSIIVSVSMRTIFTEGKETEYPYSINYEGNLDNEVVQNAIKMSNEDVDFELEAQVIPVDLTKYGSGVSGLPYANNVDIIKYSDVKKICEYRNLDNENRFLKTELKDNQGLYLTPKNLMNAFDFQISQSVENVEIDIIDDYSMNLFGWFRDNKPVIVVNDKTYSILKKQVGISNNISCITLKNFDNAEAVEQYVIANSDLNFYSANNFDQNSYSFINAIYFIGLFLALVFVVSVGSIMYFKCISDASKDKPRFDTLRKIGTSQEYISKSIYKQVGIFFILPAIVAIIHSIVAGYAVTNLFNQDGRISILFTTVLFLIIYIIYYLLTTRKYINLTK